MSQIMPNYVKAFHELRGIVGDSFDGVDPVAYVRELRGGDDEAPDVTQDERTPLARPDTPETDSERERGEGWE